MKKVKKIKVQDSVPGSKKQEELKSIVASYYHNCGSEVQFLLGLVNQTVLRSLAQSFVDCIECSEYSVLKGEVILSKQYAPDVEFPLTLLIAIYEIDKCLVRSTNCAAMTLLKFEKKSVDCYE